LPRQADRFSQVPIKLWAETQYIRAANGGTGEAKAGRKLRRSHSPTEMAKAKGYDQVLWLDAREFEYVCEVEP
jgi:branched-chain amino acid aminotransferase